MFDYSISTAGLLCGFLHPNLCHGLLLGSDGRLSYWDTVTGEQLRSLALPPGPTCAHLSPDGELVAVGTEAGEVRVLTYSQARPVKVGRGHAGPVSAVTFGPDSKTVLAATQFGATLLWRVCEGE